jgi:hypothetical protein
LHEDSATVLRDLFRTVCAVVVGAREHDAEQSSRVDLGRRLKKNVDGWARVIHGLVDRQCEATIRIDHQMVTGRREPNPRRHFLFVVGLANDQRAPRCKDFDEQAGLVLWKMNHDEDRDREIRGKSRQNSTQCFDPAG